MGEQKIKQSENEIRLKMYIGRKNYILSYIWIYSDDVLLFS